MRTGFLAIISLLLTVTLVAQDKPVVTVLDFKTNNVSEGDMGSIISLLSSALFRTRKFTVIDVAQRNTTLKELEFSLSDSADESRQLEIGRLLSASIIVVGDIASLGSRYMISSKMLETETGRTLNATDGIYLSLDSLIDDLYAFTERLAGITKQEPEEISGEELVSESDTESISSFLFDHRRGAPPRSTREKLEERLRSHGDSIASIPSKVDIAPPKLPEEKEVPEKKEDVFRTRKPGDYPEIFVGELPEVPEEEATRPRTKNLSPEERARRRRGIWGTRRDVVQTVVILAIVAGIITLAVVVPDPEPFP